VPEIGQRPVPHAHLVDQALEARHAATAAEHVQAAGRRGQGPFFGNRRHRDAVDVQCVSRGRLDVRHMLPHARPQRHRVSADILPAADAEVGREGIGLRLPLVEREAVAGRRFVAEDAGECVLRRRGVQPALDGELSPQFLLHQSRIDPASPVQLQALSAAPRNELRVARERSLVLAAGTIGRRSVQGVFQEQALAFRRFRAASHGDRCGQDGDCGNDQEALELRGPNSHLSLRLEASV
jgi:hypothetical protein